MAKSLPEITLDVSQHGNASAHWRDESARYHVWLTVVRSKTLGRPDHVSIGDELHKNTLEDVSPWIHRSLDFTAAKWSDIRMAVATLATVERIDAMQAAEIAAREAANAMHIEAWKLNRLFDAIATVRDADPEDIAAVAPDPARERVDESGRRWIDLTPTWSGVLWLYCENWCHPKDSVRESARKELTRMAAIADRYTSIFRKST